MELKCILNFAQVLSRTLMLLFGFFATRSDLMAGTFVVSPSMQGEALGLYFDTFEDPGGALGLEDILKIDAASGLKPSQEEVPNYGLKAAAQWVKFALHNPTNQPITILLEEKFAHTDDFAVYYQDGDRGWQVKRAGDRLPFAKREIQTRQVVFRFLLAPGTHVFYARSFSTGVHQLPLHIWTPDEFHHHNAVEYGLIGLLIGFHVVICLYNLFLFFSLKDRTYFVYVVYVIANLVYQGCGFGLIQHGFSLLGLMEALPSEVLVVSVDVVAMSGMLFSYHFLNIKKRLPWMAAFFKAAGALDILNILLTLFVSERLGTAGCLLTASLATTLLIVSGFLIARKGYLPAIFYLTAFGFYLCGVTGTITNLVGLVPTSAFTRWGQFTGGAIEIAILSLALGARINERRRKSMLKITELNQELENKVKERTAEIQSLLQHIPQGVLSIGNQGLVDPNYSAQLPCILNHQNIAGKSFREVVLDRSTLSDDEKDQTWQSILACIGELSLSFDLNLDKLPTQLGYRYGNVEKSLRLTWNKEVNDKDEVRHILVTLLDVSTEVIAQQEIMRQNQEFEIIRQLVEVGNRKSIQFFHSADQLIEENERLLQASIIDTDIIKILFVNTHTLKGAARSLQLKDLANELHRVEGYFASVLQNGQAIDPTRAQHDFNAIKSVYHRYRRANTETLDRADDMKKVSVDRRFLQENMQLLRHLEDLEELSLDLKHIIHAHRDELTNMIFMSLPVILSDIMEQSKKIAKDLGREPPTVEIDSDDILISYSQELALKNAFIHLLRNALDHGIEPAAERLRLGKPAQGSLRVTVKEDGGRIAITFTDDGRGLALGRIRELHRRAGGKVEDLSPQEIASLIFHSGFSTTEKVTQVSGRGVGMDAVRRFMEAEEGSVSLLLGAALDAKQEFFAFSIVLSLPSLNWDRRIKTERQLNRSA